MVNSVIWSLPILSVVIFLTGFPVCCMSANLRASLGNSFSEESMTIADSDLIGGSSFLVVQLEGYEMHDLERISPEKYAVIDCAFHRAFDEVHGDRDGIYLSGQQIVATDRDYEENEEGKTGVDDNAPFEDIELGKKKTKRPYVHRPRKFPPKPRPKPEYPPPRPSNEPLPWEEKWNIYWHMQFTGMCRMCHDDDTMGIISESKDLDLFSKNDRNQRIASDFVTSESSVDAVADALRKHLIEGSCVGENDDSFEFVRNTDIYVLSQSEFEESIAAITASVKVKDNVAEVSAEAAMDLDVASSSTAVLPFYYGNSSPTNLVADTTSGAVGLYKVGLSGVNCGAWNNEDLLDLNTGLHESINSIGLTDKGHTMDKIKGRKGIQPRFGRRFFWKCHFDVYTRLDLGGGVPDDASLDDISDALCDNLGHYGWKNKFQNVIDCQLDPVAADEYLLIVAPVDNKKVGMTVSPARD